MAENLEITIGPGFIYVVPAGTANSSSMTELFMRVPDAAHNAGVSKILYDGRSATGQISTIERYDYASRIAEGLKGFKVAFVVNPPLRDPDLFGETVANNRGGNIRVFTTLAEAYEWLEVKPADSEAEVDGK